MRSRPSGSPSPSIFALHLGGPRRGCSQPRIPRPQWRRALALPASRGAAGRLDRCHVDRLDHADDAEVDVLRALAFELGWTIKNEAQFLLNAGVKCWRVVAKSSRYHARSIHDSRVEAWRETMKGIEAGEGRIAA